MFSELKNRFKANPMWYYAMSIVASWAGVGSLMNFRTLALKNGTAPAVIWAVFNSLACILFGLLAEHPLDVHLHRLQHPDKGGEVDG